MAEEKIKNEKEIKNRKTQAEEDFYDPFLCGDIEVDKEQYEKIMKELDDEIEWGDK